MYLPKTRKKSKKNKNFYVKLLFKNLFKSHNKELVIINIFDKFFSRFDNPMKIDKVKILSSELLYRLNLYVPIKITYDIWCFS